MTSTRTTSSRRTILRGLVLAGPLALAAPALAGCAGGSSAPGNAGEVVTATVARTVFSPAEVTADATTAAAALRGFGADLTRRLLGASEDNLACSPFSVAVALAMTANGAAGTTATEMLHVLGADSLDRLNRGMGALTQVVESRAGHMQEPGGAAYDIALDSANSLWPQAGMSWKAPFLDALARWYGAGLHTVDYVKAAGPARAAINAWTSERTHTRIPELIPDGAVDATTRLVLVNALYLKAPWMTPFVPEATTPGRFVAAAGERSVPMMHQSVSVPYAEGPGWVAVTLPYAGGTLAMTLIRTDAATAADHAGWLTTANLDHALTGGAATQVLLGMPRWTFRVPSSLPRYLAAMGMPTAFGDTADFSGMTDQEKLFISDILHEVFIAVDEKGTEAAAATAVVLLAMGAVVEPKEVTLDRPFLFVIHETSTHAPLFIGRVAEPAA